MGQKFTYGVAQLGHQLRVSKSGILEAVFFPADSEDKSIYKVLGCWLSSVPCRNRMKVAIPCWLPGGSLSLLLEYAYISSHVFHGAPLTKATQVLLTLQISLLLLLPCSCEYSQRKLSTFKSSCD